MKRIEEFLNENGRKYELRIIGKQDDKIHIVVQTLEWDGDESSQEYLVKDNLLFPIEQR